MPPKIQLLALLAFAVTVLFIENQIQRLEESRTRLGKTKTRVLDCVNRDYCLIIAGFNAVCTMQTCWSKSK